MANVPAPSMEIKTEDYMLNEEVSGSSMMLSDDKSYDDDGNSTVPPKSKRELEIEEREKMQVLVSNFTEDQLDTYEMYRRSAFPKAAIKRLVQTMASCSVSQNVVIAMSGIAKVFVGEVVEEGLDVMEQWGDTGALQPKHLREAVRRLKRRTNMPKSSRGRRIFFR